MEPHANDNEPEGGLLSEIIEESLDSTPKNDPDEPRDPAWLRLSKFGALIIGPAILFGLVFAFEDYVRQFTAKDYLQQQRAEKRTQQDSVADMKLRFAIGACVGGGLGTIYVVRCIARKADP